LPEPQTALDQSDFSAHGKVVPPHPTMDIEEIKAMPVEDITADDAILWLWTTNAHLRVAFEIVDAWGFEYKSLLTWVKDRRI
jgi:N6-adenosine-specific RNA methylase IME4